MRFSSFTGDEFSTARLSNRSSFHFHPLMKKTPARILRTAFALALALTAVTSCKPADDANTIKVGEFASLTGKEATFGISSHEGTLLAVEELNAAGGVLGKKFNLITEDDLSKMGEPATVVNKL